MVNTACVNAVDDFHPLVDYMTKLRNFSEREFSAFPFLFI